MFGFDIIIPALVVRFVLLVLFTGIKTVAAGLQLYGRALRPLHKAPWRPASTSSCRSSTASAPR